MSRRLPLLLVASLLLAGSADARWFGKKKPKPMKASYGITQEQHEKRVKKLRKQAEKNRRKQAARARR